MNTKDYKKAWNETPLMRPRFIMKRDVTRGGVMYKKGVVVYGLDSRNTFTVPGYGNIALPLEAVKFTGYEDVREIFERTFK